MYLSLRDKLLFEAIIPLLLATTFVTITLLWITADQNKKSAQTSLRIANAQLKTTLDRIVEDLKQTLAAEDIAAGMAEDAKVLFESVEPETRDLKRSLQSKILQQLQTKIIHKDYDFVALYGPDELYGYASHQRIVVVTPDEQGRPVHHIPASPSARIRFSTELWQPTEPRKLTPVSDVFQQSAQVRFLFGENRFVIEAKGIIEATLFDRTRNIYETAPVAAIVLEKYITAARLRQFAEFARSRVALCSAQGLWLTASHPDIDKTHIDPLNLPRKDERLSSVKADAIQYYMMTTPYYYRTDIVAYLFAYVSKEPLRANARRVIYLYCLGLLIGLVVATAITIILTRKIAQPLADITQQMHMIATEKRFDQRVQVKTKDEIGTLAASFNQMTAILHKRNDEIDQYIEALHQSKTQLEKSERNYRSLYENALEAIFRSTVHPGRFISVNPALVEMLGYASIDEVKTQITDIARQIFVDVEDYKQLSRRLSDQSQVVGFETRIYRKDNSIIWVSLSVRAVYNEDRQLQYFEGFFIDITGRRAKEQVEKEREAAEAANQAKSEFLAHMSHEIRTPMNAILGFADILEALIADPQQKHYAQTIKSSGASLLQLINDILDLSKIEAGRMEIHNTPVSIPTLLSEVKRIFSISIAEKNIQMLLNVSPDIPGILLLDEARLRQVLFNLIGNAVKFTNEGYIKITAAAVPGRRVKHWDLSIDVRDTGVGIDPKLHDVIFETFRQHAASNTRRVEGTGLGLAISRNLIEMMGGRISLRSRVGQGSVFRIVLRNVAEAKNAKTLQPLLEYVDFDPDTIVFNPARVLVADDLEVNRDLIRTYLDATDIKILEAENGLAAIEAARKHKPDLILMDIKMPELDGYGAIARIRANEDLKAIPAVAITAAGMKEDISKILKAGFDGYLIRPFNKFELLKILTRHLPYEHEAPKTDPAGADEAKGDAQAVAAVWQCPPEVAEVLKTTLNVKWEKARRKQRIPDIEDFAEGVRGIAKQHDLTMLQEYGQTLSLYVQRFEIDGIKAMLDRFPAMVEQILPPPGEP